MTTRGFNFILPTLLALLCLSVKSSDLQPFNLWMHLDQLFTEEPGLKNLSSCSDAIVNIIDNIKNATFEQEVVSILDNTGKMFNDIGYYQSCIQAGNLSYYLIRPRRTDLKAKFNFGVCLPDHCSVDDVSTLIADGIVNKYFLAHIANGTENQPEDYNSTATIVPPNQDSSTANLEFRMFVGVFIGVSLLLPILGYFLTRGKKAESKDDNNSERALTTRIVLHVADSFNFLSNCKYLLAGRRNQANSLNFVKMVSGMLIIYSGEYMRRYYLGVHQDDKESLDRFKVSSGFNMVFFSVIAFDVLVFVSGAVNTLALMPVLQEKLERKSSLGVGDYIAFYFLSILRRFLRLAPTMYLANFVYYKINPTQLTNPLQYLYSEDFSKTCPDTYGLSFSFFANIIKGTQYCAGWTWYIQSDFQLFLILPAFLALVHSQRYIGKMVAWFFIGTSMIATMVIFFLQSLTLVGPNSTAAEVDDFMNYYQSKPWGKVAFYMGGSLISLYLLENRVRSAAQISKQEKEEQRMEVGSVLTRDIEKEAKNRFGNLGDDQKNNLKEELVPKKRLAKLKTEENREEEEEEVVAADGEEEGLDCGWLATSLIAVSSIAVVVGLFVGYLQFSKSNNSWSTFSQVMYALGARILIILAVAIAVLRFEYPLPKFTKKIYTNLGLLTTFGLGIYIWHNLFTEFLIASMPVNQYYEPLLIVYYCMSTLTQCMLYIILITLFVEIPFRRLVAYTV